jgi:tRNA (mo5U34)-methyltransferase
VPADDQGKLTFMSRLDKPLSYGLGLGARAAARGAAGLRRVSDGYARKAATDSEQPEPKLEDIVWFHSIDLGDGVVTPGVKPAETLHNEVLALNLQPDLTGKTALDIGAWDGYFSYELERRNARRVVSLDHYAWSIDHPAYIRYHNETLAAGRTPKPPEEVSRAWDAVGLPGRAGFDLARKRLNSSVEPMVGDFMEMDLKAIGKFDIVLFLGVLYHLKDPFLALRRLREVTRDIAVIETACVILPGWTEDRLWMFIEATELDGDASNWWAPTATGLLAACRAAGFRDARVILEAPEFTPPNGDYRLHYGRITVHAYA